jgi:hypothetical protein
MSKEIIVPIIVSIINMNTTTTITIIAIKKLPLKPYTFAAIGYCGNFV